jgi:hypothetical protein
MGLIITKRPTRSRRIIAIEFALFCVKDYPTSEYKPNGRFIRNCCAGLLLKGKNF